VKSNGGRRGVPKKEASMSDDNIDDGAHEAAELPLEERIDAIMADVAAVLHKPIGPRDRPPPS
jgi:hypothetical protein